MYILFIKVLICKIKKTKTRTTYTCSHINNTHRHTHNGRNYGRILTVSRPGLVGISVMFCPLPDAFLHFPQ